jgi:hypothetical protein
MRRPPILAASPDAGRRAAAGLLAAALTLHDLEEALAYPAVRPRLLGFAPLAPAPEVAWAALAAVTGLGLGMAGWAASGETTGGKRLALRALAWGLLVNVLVPHVPAAFVLGGYAPGVVTALAVNLPVALLALRLLRGRS